jgi:hypothetical protein
MLRAAVLALVACHNSPPPTPTPPPSSGSSEATTPPPAAGPGIAEKCGDNDACAGGLECVHYRGIAGAAGPEFKTCEKRCDADAACPEGKHCATVADGPGRVCR